MAEAKAEARATAVEEAADEAAVEEFHSNVAAALATEMAILPVKMAGKLEQTRSENVICAAILITRPILVIRPKTFEPFSSPRKADIKMKKNTPI